MATITMGWSAFTKGEQAEPPVPDEVYPVGPFADVDVRRRQTGQPGQRERDTTHDRKGRQRGVWGVEVGTCQASTTEPRVSVF